MNNDITRHTDTTTDSYYDCNYSYKGTENEPLQDREYEIKCEHEVLAFHSSKYKLHIRNNNSRFKYPIIVMKAMPIKRKRVFVFNTKMI